MKQEKDVIIMVGKQCPFATLREIILLFTIITIKNLSKIIENHFHSFLHIPSFQKCSFIIICHHSDRMNMKRYFVML